MNPELLDRFSTLPDVAGAFASSALAKISNEALVISFTALILITFFNYYVRMLRDTSRALKTLAKLRGLLELATGKKHIRTIKDRDEAQKKIREIQNDSSFIKYIEKNEILSWWDQISHNFTYEIAGHKVFTTTEFINSFLNFDKFITSHTSRGVLSAPAILTGLGIIGTFLGLSIGVGSASSGLASPDISVARNAMSQLLEGAQLAFITSLAGLLCALVIRQAFTSRSEKIRLRIEDLNNLLSAVAIPKDSGISGLGALVQIQKNTQGLLNSDIPTTLRGNSAGLRAPTASDNRLASIEQKLEKIASDLANIKDTSNE